MKEKLLFYGLIALLIGAFAFFFGAHLSLFEIKLWLYISFVFLFAFFLSLFKEDENPYVSIKKGDVYKCNISNNIHYVKVESTKDEWINYRVISSNKYLPNDNLTEKSFREIYING